MILFNQLRGKVAFHMNAFALFFAILGASYVSWLIMKFIIWIDGADDLECEEMSCCEEALKTETEAQRRAA